MTNKKTEKKELKGSTMEKQKSEERVFYSRKHPRIPFEMEVEFKIGSEYQKGLTRNISQGGIFITIAEPLADGTNTYVKFTMDPRRKPLELAGKVAWKFDAKNEERPEITEGMGIEFNYKNDLERDEIYGFVRDLLDQWLTSPRIGAKDN